MQAQVTYEGDVCIVNLIGQMDIESADQFRRACLKLLKNKKVVFGFAKLNFVGSSGILPFLEAIHDFNQVNPIAPRFSGASTEFIRILSASPLAAIEVYEESSAAARSFARAELEAQGLHVIAPVQLHTIVNSPQQYDNPNQPKRDFGVLSLRYDNDEGHAGQGAAVSPAPEAEPSAEASD